MTERADKFLRAHPKSLLTPNVHLVKKAAKQQADNFINQEVARVEGRITPQSGGAAVTGAGPEKALQEVYDRGMAYLQAKEYDKAIEHFNRLQRTPYETKSHPQLAEAAKLAAQDLRQKAADLFVRANGSSDPEEKRKLLLTSRDLLQNILVKYPQSGLTDKVERNLARVEAELRAIDGVKTKPLPVTSGGA